MSQKTYPQLLREAASLIEEALNSSTTSSSTSSNSSGV